MNKEDAEQLERDATEEDGLRQQQMRCPTVGRIVHYTNLGDRDGRFPPEPHAAMITKRVAKTAEQRKSATRDEQHWTVSLRIFYETGTFTMKGVPFSEEPPGSEAARGCWGWPPRV